MAVMSRIDLPTAAAASLLISLACLAHAAAALGAEAGPPQRIAALGGDGPPAQLSAGADAGRLLAQGLPAPAGPAGAIEVLATFDKSLPETAEEDVARAHALLLVSRDTMGELRIVLFRSRDGRGIEEVLAALRGDRRVAGVQANLRYRLPEQPPAAVSRLEPKPAPAAAARTPQPARSRSEAAATAKTHGRRGGRVAAVENAPADGAAGASAPPRRHPGLVAGSQQALRFPTADEPFVGVGGRSR